MRRGGGTAMAARLPGAARRRSRTHCVVNLMAVTSKSWWPAVKAMPHAVQDQPDAKPVNAQL